MSEYDIVRNVNDNLSVLQTNLLRDLEDVKGRIKIVQNGVDSVKTDVSVVTKELKSLANDFKAYVEEAKRRDNLQTAETRIISIRQELEQRFGHYAEVRKTTTGILQANDLNIIRKDTIADVTEENMLLTPNYWLAPCLVALAAWINDKPEIADRAVREAIKRDDEKTSLLFALICRRANRKKACLKWAGRYFDNQEAENLDRKCIIMLDAYASGLLGADSENLVAEHIEKWIDELKEKPGFTERQKDQWAKAIYTKRQPITLSKYPYLQKYSTTWPQIKDVLEGAYLHSIMFSYLENVFSQTRDMSSVNEQLDKIVDSLVSEFDDEELPLRKEERLNKLIVQYNGDKSYAEKTLKGEETVFEDHKDFTQLLTDAAMNPESTNSAPSTQQFALALSKEWVSEAYMDIKGKNDSKVPVEIELKVGLRYTEYKGKTRDGKNEQVLISAFSQMANFERDNILAQTVLTSGQAASLVAGIIIGVIGLIMLFTGLPIFGVIAAVVGVVMVIKYFDAKKRIDTTRFAIIDEYQNIINNGSQVLRACCAEIVDFRMEFGERNAESEKVINFIENLQPSQYIKNLNSKRRVKLDA